MFSTPVLVALLLCVASFFICAIPSGLLLAKQLGGIDVRDVGSHNIGSTNVARTAGAKVGALTLAADMLKGFVCTFVSRLALGAMVDAETLTPSGSNGVLLCLVYGACVCGHCFSPYLKFKGGKGIAVGCGAAFGFIPMVSLGLLAVFGSVALAGKIVSVASICAALSLPVLAFLLYGATPTCLGVLSCISAVVIWRHHENIVRLMRGEEKPFSLGHKERA